MVGFRLCLKITHIQSFVLRFWPLVGVRECILAGVGESEFCLVLFLLFFILL